MRSVRWRLDVVSYIEGWNLPLLTDLLEQFDESQPSRALNTPFQVNATRWAYVQYTVRIECSGSTTLLGGSATAGRVEFRRDSANPPTTVRCQARESVQLAQTLGLTVGITSTVIEDYVIGGWVPPGHYVSLATVNESNTPTYTLVKTQEWVAQGPT